MVSYGFQVFNCAEVTVQTRNSKRTTLVQVIQVREKIDGSEYLKDGHLPVSMSVSNVYRS